MPILSYKSPSKSMQPFPYVPLIIALTCLAGALAIFIAACVLHLIGIRLSLSNGVCVGVLAFVLFWVGEPAALTAYYTSYNRFHGDKLIAVIFASIACIVGIPLVLYAAAVV